MNDKTGSFEGIYEKLQEACKDMSDRFNIDNFTLENRVISTFDKTYRKMLFGGYREVPPKYGSVKSVKWVNGTSALQMYMPIRDSQFMPPTKEELIMRYIHRNHKGKRIEVNNER